MRIVHCSLLLASLFSLSSCSLTAVGEFANQSSQALAQGPAILKDVEASCIRRQMTLGQAQYYGLDQPDSAAKAQADAAKNCEAFTSKTPDLLAASKAVTDYFSALSQLASAGKSSAGKDSGGADAKTAKTPESQTLLKATGNIVEAVGKLAAEGYRAKHLEKDLTSVAPDVDAVLKALKAVGDVDYNRLLINEQQAYEEQFNVPLQELGAPAAKDSPQLKLLRVLAKDDESTQERLIAAKHAAANAYGDAIDKILAGHKALLAHQGKLDAKDVPGLVQPFTDDLSKIVQSLTQIF